ncbi:hypothetical protein AAG570_003354 [Ranatra chinensis]|uniref:Nucleolar complex protein 2 homolog n=1 Tax=Ranatra chinensis TaxID=642074 RepID=A0ABD0Y3C7_9HEMI
MKNKMVQKRKQHKSAAKMSPKPQENSEGEGCEEMEEESVFENNDILEEESNEEMEEEEGEDEDEEEGGEDEEDEKAEDDSDSDSLDEGTEHKKALSKLKQSDPEFYKYLEENDRKLLQFNVSDSDDDQEDEEDEEMLHKPPTSLEVDSEESDFEDGKSTKSGKVITLAMVEEWRKDLIENPSKESLEKAVDGFHAALDRVTGDDTSVMRVDSSAVFNSVIETCVMHLQPAVSSFLKLSPANLKNPEKAKKWNKVKTLLVSYFTDLLKLLGGVASEHIISVLLKHLHTFCPFLPHFGKLSKLALKRLTTLWSTGEETVRVLAFLCIVRMTTSNKSNALLNTTLKMMYIAYIRSSKFLSINNIAQVNFMRTSLSNLFALDPALSYQHAFLYIRQLAIHLRNAVSVHKKENFQAVYNWQYMHSLRLWVDLLCATGENCELRQLLYPVVQIIIGCMKLIPTAQYVPLRFHCVQLLIKLGRETDVHIPVLPFILKALSCVDLNKQSKKVSMKPFDLTCILRMSKGAMLENAFPDAIVENVYNLLVEATSSQAHKINFPDLVLPLTFQLRAFLKDCKVSKYTSKLKQILTKIEENSKFVNTERNKLVLNLLEAEKIKAFEANMLATGTPLGKFAEQWRKVHVLQRMKRATEKAKVSGLFNFF